MRTIKFILTLLVSIFIGQQTVFALGVDELLLDRLVKKGVITPEDAAGIRAEAAVKAQEELKAKKRFNVEGKTRIDLSGYLHFQYAADEATGKFDGFKIRRVRLDFRGDVSKDIGWRTQLDAVQPLKNVVEKVTQKDAATVTTTTTKAVTRPVLLDAYLDYKPYSFANFRIGQFKLPFGQENLESSPKRDIINRSQVTERLVPGRDIGSILITNLIRLLILE
ncbi:hypothetical protein HY792_02010 [Candidatus Desantisbacteria bacterium]|nr:hypothetical protein [Candidatus Desantisbacteria bacterium]